MADSLPGRECARSNRLEARTPKGSGVVPKRSRPNRLIRPLLLALAAMVLTRDAEALSPFNYITTPVDVSPAGTGWQTVDVSASVPANATGVIVQWQGEVSGADQDFGIRKMGSTDGQFQDAAKADQQGWLMIGVDSSRRFEVYRQTTGIKVYLVGYTMSGVKFFTNRIDKSTGTFSPTWADVSIAADTGTDTAIGAIFYVRGVPGTVNYAIRKKGSTDDRFYEARDEMINVVIIGEDGTETAQQKITGANLPNLYLVGYVTSGAVFFTNAILKTDTAAYTDVDITADIGTNDANGAFLEISNTGANDRFVAVRPNGATYDFNLGVRHQFALVGIDSADIFEQKTANTSETLLHLTGYSLQGTTAVELQSFAASAGDSTVSVAWETASELDNLGFHLYRGLSADGPWHRLNAALIPGLGSSPEGKAYSWTDRGLANGRTYYYRLEDVDRSGQITSHGPVSAVQVAGVPADDASGSGDSEASPQPSPGAEWTAHGNPSDLSLRVLQRNARGVTLELRTGGFYSLELPDGSVRLHVPGFFDTAEPGLPAVPVKRAWVDAVVGRNARVVGVRAAEVRSFPRLLPQRVGAPEARAQRDGTYRASFRRVGSKDEGVLYPRSAARVLETAFQEEMKRAYLELAPLRLDSPRRRLELAQRLVVKIAFDERVPGEAGAGGTRGRRRPASARAEKQTLLARLAARAAGLHAVSWESLAASAAARQRDGQTFPISGLRLSRLGRAVAFHVEPRADRFGPGSTLYFVAQGPEAAYANETVFELALSSGGVPMSVERSTRTTATTPVSAFVTSRSFEQNTNYLPALLAARDPWFWDLGLLAPNGRDYPFTLAPFTLAAPSATGEPARLAVELQGGSDVRDVDPDHQVRVFVNGVPVGEASWDGLNPKRFEASFDAGVLLDGANTLRLENLDTTGRFDSAVYLDRFTVEYTRRLVADNGRLEGRSPASGLVRAAGFSPGTLLLDVTAAVPTVLTPSATGAELVFTADAQKSYLAVSREAVLRPEVRPASAQTLRAASLQADWIVIAPKELLPAAEPLVAHREGQGLRVMAVSLEQVQDEFGYGERSPQLIREFLAYAYHHWAAPSVRYVLLLGDASYDPKGYLPTAARKDLLPTPFVKSMFLWTASDPSLAAVNGDDAIPDLAIGRLSAGSLAEAEAAVQKILAFEASGQSLNGNAVLVADNPDLAGDFEANLNDIASLLPGREVDRIFLSQRGAGTRSAVLGAFDAGASLVSYVGHGSQALWASEAILRSIDAPLLQPQPRQPLLLTMTSSNGYFISPWLNGIAERFVLEGGKGAIAAFSPSGLSLDGAAHLYHRVLVGELESRRHERLGDLVLAAQKDYADTGAFPELLSFYHLFADPALLIR